MNLLEGIYPSVSFGGELPTCARCGRPVDSVTRHLFEMTREYLYVARCHGETEEMRLAEEVLVAGLSLSAGVAFKPALLKRMGE